MSDEIKKKNIKYQDYQQKMILSSYKLLWVQN